MFIYTYYQHRYLKNMSFDSKLMKNFSRPKIDFQIAKTLEPKVVDPYNPGNS